MTDARSEMAETSDRLQRCDAHGFAVAGTSHRCPAGQPDGSDCRLIAISGHTPKVWWNDDGTPAWEYVVFRPDTKSYADQPAATPRASRSPRRDTPMRVEHAGRLSSSGE